MDVNSDEDSLPDVVEKFGLMFNGTPIETNIYKEDTDDDGLWDDEEVIFDRTAFIAGLEKGVCTEGITYFANPTEPHSDTDGLRDDEDAEPMEMYDERFMFVDGLDYIPTIDFVEERYQRSQDCYCKYGTVIELPDGNVIKNSSATGTNLIGFLAAFASMENDYSFLDEAISNLFGFKYKLDFGDHSERAENKKSMDHAADALVRYFGASGDTLEYLESDTCELISCSKNNIDHLHRNLTRTMQCAEQILCDNQSVIIASQSDSGFKATCNVDRGIFDGIPCDIMEDNGCASYHINGIHFNYVNRDWFNTVGEAGASIVAEITRSDNTYTMNYTYYFIDIYEWAYHYDDDPLSGYFHSYHESGLAQEYLMKGSFSGSLSWEKGETAYMTGVLEQISDTLQYWQSESSWEDSNEYDRFIADVAERGITN